MHASSLASSLLLLHVLAIATKHELRRSGSRAALSDDVRAGADACGRGRCPRKELLEAPALVD